jgi:protein tyrosine phosphatase (PTP) superfamily phosphohydrolase (DUF442 family)
MDNFRDLPRIRQRHVTADHISGTAQALGCPRHSLLHFCKSSLLSQPMYKNSELSNKINDLSQIFA